MVCISSLPSLPLSITPSLHHSLPLSLPPSLPPSITLSLSPSLHHSLPLKQMLEEETVAQKHIIHLEKMKTEKVHIIIIQHNMYTHTHTTRSMRRWRSTRVDWWQSWNRRKQSYKETLLSWPRTRHGASSSTERLLNSGKKYDLYLHFKLPSCAIVFSWSASSFSNII